MEPHPVMMMSAEKNDITINRSEVMRYLRYDKLKVSETVNKAMDKGIKEFMEVVSYRLCFLRLPLYISDSYIDLGFTQINSIDLSKNLKGCFEVVLFAATLGMGVDRLITSYSRLLPSMATIIDTIGSVAIESWCDKYNEKIKDSMAKEGQYISSRFSPGYGDFSIEHQKDILSVLNANRKIGICLTDGYMMVPRKSVSAIIGIHK